MYSQLQVLRYNSDEEVVYMMLGLYKSMKFLS